ncbi:MAG: hypothetical protein IJM76_05740 [Lachnospiraceae bacterium]|nr:hypothetical protein [Lachnospiraceae bacterium]
MIYGRELIERLEKEIQATYEVMERRNERIRNWETDEDDCFMSIRAEEHSLQGNRDKIRLIKDGGCAWFTEYATMDGTLVDAHWCDTRYGWRLRVTMPDGSVVWCGGKKSLANKGLKRVLCLRPAWYAYKSPYRGLLGAYSGSYELFPSDYNYATGEPAGADPIEVRDCED